MQFYGVQYLYVEYNPYAVLESTLLTPRFFIIKAWHTCLVHPPCYKEFRVDVVETSVKGSKIPMTCMYEHAAKTFSYFRFCRTLRAKYRQQRIISVNQP